VNPLASIVLADASLLLNAQSMVAMLTIISAEDYVQQAMAERIELSIQDRLHSTLLFNITAMTAWMAAWRHA
jgi:hypothetical protein